MLRDAERLSDAGVGDGHTLHLVDMPPGAAPGPPPPPAAGAGAADGPGLVPDMFGGMFGGLGGVPGAAPGVQGEPERVAAWRGKEGGRVRAAAHPLQLLVLACL